MKLFLSAVRGDVLFYFLKTLRYLKQGLCLKSCVSRCVDTYRSHGIYNIENILILIVYEYGNKIK